MAQHHPPDLDGWQPQDDWSWHHLHEISAPSGWNPPRRWSESPPRAAVSVSRSGVESWPQEKDPRLVPEDQKDDKLDDRPPVQITSSSQPESKIDTQIQPYKQPTKHPPESGHFIRVSPPSSEPNLDARDLTSSSENYAIPHFDTIEHRPALQLESQMSPRPHLEPSPPFQPGWRPPPSPIPPPPRIEGAPSLQYAQILPEDSSWSRIRMLREDNWKIRSQIHELRAVLRDKQIEKSTADDRLIQHILARELLPPDQNHNLKEAKSITELQKDCQAARDEYGPLEDDCNQIEDRLSRQEFELTNLEKQLYAPIPNLSPQFQQQRPPPPIHQQPSATPSITNSDDSSDDEPYHPAVKQYLSLLGDLDILQERLDDFTEERESLEEQLSSRLRFGLHLDVDDQAWLDNASTAYAELLSEIQIVQAQVDALHEDCFEKGLIDEDGEPTDFATQERFALRGEVDSKGEVSEYIKYPQLLPIPNPNPNPQKPDPSEILVHSALRQTSLGAVQLSTPSSTSTIPPILRINQWLLQRLCTSAFEVNLLASTFELRVGAIADGWQVAVLAVWFADRTMKRVVLAGTRAYDERSMQTQAPARIDTGTEEDDGDEHEEEEEDHEDEESPSEGNDVESAIGNGGPHSSQLVLSPSYKLPSNRSIALEGPDGGVIVAAGPIWGNGGAKMPASC